MLKLKFQYFDHLMRRAKSLEKILMLGKIEGRRRMEWQDEMGGWHHQFSGYEWANSRKQRKTGRSGVLQSIESQRVRYHLVTEQQGKEINNCQKLDSYIFCCPTNGSFYTKIWKWEYTVLAAPKEVRTPAREKERLLAKNKSTLISRFISRCWNDSNPRKPMPSEWKQIIEGKKDVSLI